MKVKELIKHLRSLNPDMEVVVEVDTSGKIDDWGVFYTKVQDISVINAGPKLGMPQVFAITPKGGKSLLLLK